MRKFLRNLPPDSRHWADRPGGKASGWTIAHIAAASGLLPKGFSQWELEGKDGTTVAQFALNYGRIPDWFDRWEITDRDSGVPIAHFAAFKGLLPASAPRAVWMLRDPLGCTPYHAAAEGGRLPEGFDRWDVASPAGWTVAHTAALHGTLPPDVPEEVLRYRCEDGADDIRDDTVAGIVLYVLGGAEGLPAVDEKGWSGRGVSLPPNDPVTVARARKVLDAMMAEEAATAGGNGGDAGDAPPSAPASARTKKRGGRRT
jgi:hypothetical protein